MSSGHCSISLGVLALLLLANFLRSGFGPSQFPRSKLVNSQAYLLHMKMSDRTERVFYSNKNITIEITSECFLPLVDGTCRRRIIVSQLVEEIFSFSVNSWRAFCASACIVHRVALDCDFIERIESTRQSSGHC